MKNHTDGVIYDVLTFGSITLDIFITPQEAVEVGNDFVVPIGEKILLRDIFKSVGGSSANASVGFVKLGLRTGTFGFIGEDRGGTSIRTILAEEGLETRYITVSDKSESSMSVILNAQDGRRSVFNYKNPMEDFDPEHLWESPQTRAIYVGHLTGKSEDFLLAIPEWKMSTGTHFAWNPGKTQFDRGIDFYRPLLAVTDTLILNKEEAEYFTGKKAIELDIEEATSEQIGHTVPIDPVYPIETIFDMHPMVWDFLECGVKKIVITDGKRGAQIFTYDGAHMRCGAPDVRVISTLGAGDAFSVGVVSAELYGEPVDRQILWGSWSSGCVIQEFGAQKGQASLEKMRILVR